MANIIKQRDRGEMLFTSPLIGMKLGAEGENHYWRAYSAAWGLVPYADEPAILATTAFNKTLQEQGNAIPIVFNHNMDMPIARNGGNSVDNYGMQYTAFPDLSGEDPESARIYRKIKSGQLFQNSIGFYPKKTQKDKETGLPIYTEAYLGHHSVVTKGANPKANMIEVYSALDAEEYGATSYQNLPIVEKDWDAGAAKKRVAAWAGGEDMDWSKYAKAFLWFDSSDREKIGSYKLPYADVIDGSLKAVSRGIFAAAAAIQGARGGVDIPEADIARIRAHLARYYKRMDKEVPWSSSDIITFRLDELQDYVIILTEAERALQEAEPGSRETTPPGAHFGEPQRREPRKHSRELARLLKETLTLFGGS